MVRYNISKRKSAIVFVYLTVVIDMLGVMLVIPIMANLAREIQGEPASCECTADMAVSAIECVEGGFIGPGMADQCDTDRANMNANVGLMNNLFSAGALISSLVMPRISDSLGRRIAFFLSLGGSIFGFLGMALAPTFPILLGIRFIAGLFGGSATVANAYITDVYPPAEQGGMFARLGATIMMAVLLGPTLGGTLANVFGLRGPLWVATLASAVALLCAFKYIVNPSAIVIEDGKEDSVTSPLMVDTNNTNADDTDMESGKSVEMVVKSNSKSSSGDIDPTAPSSTEAGNAQVTGKKKVRFNPWLDPAILAIGLQTFCATVGEVSQKHNSEIHIRSDETR